jgi:hypothetical protein
MAVLGLLHVEWYPVHWDHIQGNLPESCQKTDSDRRLRLGWFRAAGFRCLLKGGEKGVDIHVGEFLGLLRL